MRLKEFQTMQSTESLNTKYFRGSRAQIWQIKTWMERLEVISS